MRIKELRQKKNWTQDELGDAIGISKGVISSYENERTQPPLNLVIRFTEVLNCTLEYLLKGHSQYRSTVQGEANSVQDRAVKYHSANYLVPIRAQAGLGVEYGTEVLDGDLKPLVIPGVEYPAYTFEVEGDSMEPLLYEGDYVVCKREEDWSKLTNKAIYLVITRSSGVYIKLFKALSGSQFVFSSTNPSYKDTRLDHDDVREVWEATVRLSFHITADGMPSNEIKRFQQLEDFIKQKFPDYNND